MTNYIVELSVIHMALMLGYWFFLRNEQQYAKMRFYLVGSTLLALTIPLLKLPKLFNNKEAIDAAPMELIRLDNFTITSGTDTSFWNYDLLIWLYMAITVFFSFKFFGNVLHLIHLYRKSNGEKFSDVYIRKVRDIKGSFTFFNWIFLSDEIDQNQQDYDVILKHEKAHVSLGHTYDIIFFELFKVCFWWLPTAWFVNKEIREIHEYQADAIALKSYNVDQYSSVLISSTLKLNGVNLASSFHDGLILKRLIAMKQQAKNVSPWKLGALSAMCALLIAVFACTEQVDDKADVNTETSKKGGEVFTVVEALPAFEGGMDAFYRYVANEIKYPLLARKTGVEGRVDVQFVVEKDGSLSDVKAINGIGAGCDAEAVRVVQNAPRFMPGTQQGKPVRVQMVMPIIFKLNEDKINADKSTQGMVIVEEVQSINRKFKVDVRYGDGEWSGTVYDEEGNRLPGVNILVAGTTTGTVSDLDGSFKLKAKEENDLYLSFIGYETVRVEGREK
jgi:TonB family protein